MMENRRGNILDTVPLTPLVSSGGKLIAEAAAWYNESIPLNEPLISPATKSGRTFYTSLGHSSSSESIQNVGGVSLTESLGGREVHPARPRGITMGPRIVLWTLIQRQILLGRD
jgi:hypothetical protein